MATVDSTSERRVPRKPAGDLLDRLPPQNLDAERGVLGSILLDPEMCDEIALVLRADEFYSDAHAKLFAQMMKMHEEGHRIDVLLLVDRLTQAGQLEDTGGISYLTEIAEGVPTAAHAIHYARIVREKATLRSLIRASTDILRETYEPSQESRDLVNFAEEKIFAIRDQRGGGDVNSMDDVLKEALVRIDERMQHDHTLTGVETGYADLDAMLGGLHGSELIIIAARPSMGKTAFACNIVEHATMVDGNAALFVSLEMSRYELADRMLCSHSRVNGHRLRNGTISKEEKSKLVEHASLMSQAPLFIDDTPSRTMTEIAATARRLKRSQGLKLIAIDYLQLIEPDNARDPRQEQVAKIARRLKGLARELDVPVVCLAQLNRQTEQGRDGHRPKLSQLRESGAIEQDADVVMFVHREEYYESDPEARAQIAGQAEIIVAKQRNGPTGEVKLIWRHEFMRFENCALDFQDDGF